MNLPLHPGWLGVFEASLIAFAIGVFAYAFWNWLAGRLGWSQGRAIGWACVSAIVVAAGIDSWNLFYLGVVRLESPLYARIALSKMHDADFLGSRVFMEWTAAIAGVVLAWAVLARREARPAD